MENFVQAAQRAGGVRFMSAESSLGTLLLAGGAGGLSEIALADSAEVARQALSMRFPHAQPASQDPDLIDWCARICAWIEAPHRAPLALPYVMHGTPFQIRVWQTLREIPPGQTVSYAALAARLGLPRGARAVASACAANRLALLVPCHRVVRSDGGLAGYRWGVERKRALLQRESVQ